MNTQQKHSRFECLEVALVAAREVGGLARLIAQFDADLARQVRKAMASVPMNLSEGNRRRGRDRLHMFRIAAGSADEVATALRVAEAFGYVERDQVAGALELLDRVLAMTWRLTNGRRR